MLNQINPQSEAMTKKSRATILFSFTAVKPN